MDLKALRTPTFTALELATARASTQARATRLVHSATKPARVLEPVARSEIWKQYHAGALRDGHPEPERFADAAVRERTQTLLKKEKRAKVAFLSDPPKPPTAAAIEAGSKPSARNKAPATKCQAKTLEGRQCGFAATCGPFCKKHAPKEAAPAPFMLVQRRFASVRLKGYINAPPALVERVLGKPNGTPDDKIEKEWLWVFSDGTPATAFFTRTDPALHICGEDVGVIGRVRQLLAL